MRFTMTRAVSGFSGCASQSASCSRPLPEVIFVSRSLVEHLREAARHDLAEPFVVAADEDRRILEAFVPRAFGPPSWTATATGFDDRLLVPQHLQLGVHRFEFASAPPRAAVVDVPRPGGQNGPRGESSSAVKSIGGSRAGFFGSSV